MTRPASREHMERFVDTFDTLTGRDFDRALKACMHRAGGLSWLTDEQVKDIASEMLSGLRRQRRMDGENRRAMRRAA